MIKIEKRKVKRYSMTKQTYQVFRNDIIDINEDASEVNEWYNPQSTMYIMEFLYEENKK